VHVDDNALTAFVAGELAPVEQSRIRDHLDDCEDCRAVIALAVEQHRHATPSRMDTALAAGSIEASVRPSQRKLLQAGAQVGPYVVERLVGAGGMGLVYAARDPRLDRLVALKLIRHQTGLSREQITDRMRRESKALARLSHANVTVVYELGTAGEEIFVAMEYVAGATLRAWLRAMPRTAAEIVATFSAAGRGLAAAHAAGLVHRDFKPDNVLIAEDGVAKVTDFGLARIAGEVGAPDESLGSPSSPHAERSYAIELTATGSVVGTPAYMSPEQFAAAEVDGRADQFAFCVALYEALYGERPFRGSTVEELKTAVLAGLVTAPRDARVPARVRRAVLRGLAVARDDRFAAMDDLLAQLAPRRTAVLLGVGGGAIATAAIAAVVIAQRGDGAVCRGAEAEVAAVWNAKRRSEIERAFTPKHGDTFAAVAGGLDDYFARWVKMSTEACEATRVHEQQSEAALDLRTACLGRQRAQVGAIVDVLAQADANVVLHAREAIAALPSLAICIDVRQAPEPVEPALRAGVDAARAKVTVARYDEALTALESYAAEPALQKHAALEAEVHFLRAKIFTAQSKGKEAEQALFRGLARAQAARDQAMIATMQVDLAHVVGFKGQRADDGLRWADLAAAAITAQGGNELLTIRLASVRAAILQREGKLPEAEIAGREALAAARSKAAGTALEGEVSDALAAVLAMQGKLDEAVPLFESALALTERAYGKQHSITASVHANLANTLGAVKRDTEALAHFQAALEIDEALFGKDGAQVGSVLSNLGKLLQERGKLAEARTHLERALAIREKAYGADDPAVARTAANLAYLLLDTKDYRAALAMFARTGTILEKRFGEDHPARADDLAGTGLALIGLGKPADAIAPLERAATLAAKGDPVNAASIRASLGRALYESRNDKARGVKLARDARVILVEAGESVADIDEWLPR
jgi:eukaryotic-like serine/threonine-protein kinase